MEPVHLVGGHSVQTNLCNQATLSNAASLLGPKGAHSVKTGLCNQANLTIAASLLGPKGWPLSLGVSDSGNALTEK